MRTGEFGAALRRRFDCMSWLLALAAISVAVRAEASIIVPSLSPASSPRVASMSVDDRPVAAWPQRDRDADSPLFPVFDVPAEMKSPDRPTESGPVKGAPWSPTSSAPTIEMSGWLLLRDDLSPIPPLSDGLLRPPEA